ncbi:hypothetical protein HPG69_011055 [Diceros bicornis minor]|uniref:Uncharacterized protein n=1 Tax=Diceros bicornis minor TaxID=77932 RepID=A0A7J7F707_DICBM|nr:hypothetical protein HPG69_011055 [Diceros bicornis minor]
MSFIELYLSIHRSLRKSFNDLGKFDTLDNFEMSHLPSSKYIHTENVEQNVRQWNKDKINLLPRPIPLERITNTEEVIFKPKFEQTKTKLRDSQGRKREEKRKANRRKSKCLSRYRERKKKIKKIIISKKYLDDSAPKMRNDSNREKTEDSKPTQTLISALQSPRLILKDITNVYLSPAVKIRKLNLFPEKNKEIPPMTFPTSRCTVSMNYKSLTHFEIKNRGTF